MEIHDFIKYKDQMKRLQDSCLVTNLSCFPKLPGFYFNLGKVKFIGGVRIYEDFSRYQYRIYFMNDIPVVHKIPFIRSYKYFKHMYNFGNLCLYHHSEFDWSKNPYLDKYIVPWIYTWQLYYNEWERTGNWPGREYPHQNK